MPSGKTLLRFATAAQELNGDLPAARAELEAVLGADALNEAAATVAVFNGLVRIADGTGIQVDGGVLADSADFRAELGVDGYAGAANTETVPRRVDRNSVSDLFA